MARSVRWLVPARWLIAVASTVGAFGICLWSFRFVSFSWMPHAEADRWVVATAFAAVAAGAVGAATGWWAGREHKRPDLPSTKVATQTSPLGRQAVSGGEGLARRSPIICGCVRSGIGVGSSTDQPLLVPAGEELASLGGPGCSELEVPGFASDSAFLGG
jgi:hypothetical protein